MRLTYIIILITLSGFDPKLNAQQRIYTGKHGSVHFRSDAPLELIDAISDQLSGAINPDTRGVAFSVRISSFHGFNSPVQREHFMENYLESVKFPVATFTGRIIEKIRFFEDGAHNIRVKGILNIHGVSTERIIPGMLTIDGDTIAVTATFTVPLDEHAISVPKLLSLDAKTPQARESVT